MSILDEKLLPPLNYFDKLLHKIVINRNENNLATECVKEFKMLAQNYKLKFGLNKNHDGRLRFEESILCSQCWKIDKEVISLPCAHIICRNCFIDDPIKDRCNVCMKLIYLPKLTAKPNYKLNNLVRQILKFTEEFETKRESANNKLRSNNYFEAVNDYSELLKFQYCQHFVLSNRCYAFLLIQKYELALWDSLKLLKIAWNWKKAHYRRAMIFKRLNQIYHSLEYLMNALTLDPDDIFIIKEFETMLSRLMTEDFIEEIKRKCVSIPVNKNTFQMSLLKLIYIGQNQQYESILAICNDSKLESKNFNLALKYKQKDSQFLNVENVSKNKQSASGIKEVERRQCFDINMIRQYVRVDDFECPLCIQIFINPVALFCGHTFCRHCLQRSMDYTSLCPLCKCDLSIYYCRIKLIVSTNIKSLLDILWPLVVSEYQDSYNKELLHLTKSLDHCQFMVCTVAFPGITYKFQIFEPRYRLMLRRCVEVNNGRFGMIFHDFNHPNSHAQIGSILQIKKVQTQLDGRYHMCSIAMKQRLKVVRSRIVDGYVFADVEDYNDVQMDLTHINGLHETMLKLYESANKWYSKLPTIQKSGINTHYGSFPNFQNYVSDLPNKKYSCNDYKIEIIPLNGPVRRNSVGCITRRQNQSTVHPIHHRHTQSLCEKGCTILHSTEQTPCWIWWLCAVLPIDDDVKYLLLSSNDATERVTYLKNILDSLNSQTRCI